MASPSIVTVQKKQTDSVCDIQIVQISWPLWFWLLVLPFDRDDDWGAQYNFVPSNTLLEPNNVIPSWEFGDEENKEVSATLRRIRQKYDNIHKTVLAKERELETKKVSRQICRLCLNYNIYLSVTERTRVSQKRGKLDWGQHLLKDSWLERHQGQVRWNSKYTWVPNDGSKILWAHDPQDEIRLDCHPNQIQRDSRQLQEQAASPLRGIW